MTEQGKPTEGVKLLKDILLVLTELLRELQKKPNKARKRKKQGELWPATETASKSKWDAVQAVNDQAEAALQAQLAAERKRREERHGVVSSAQARNAAERLAAKSRDVLRGPPSA